MDIDKFISQFLDKKGEEMGEFKGKYSRLRKKRTYSEWERLYLNWIKQKKSPKILLSDD
ncbi:MAG: hypothetical protein ACXADW_20425 [Candidatus Hodarchaeales archaeon]|jgi:hypothetical protein